MLSGTPTAFSACWIRVTDSPSDTPLARLNETVVAGNWPRWLDWSGAACSRMVAMAESGTAPLVVDCR